METETKDKLKVADILSGKLISLCMSSISVCILLIYIDRQIDR